MTSGVGESRAFGKGSKGAMHKRKKKGGDKCGADKKKKKVTQKRKEAPAENYVRCTYDFAQRLTHTRRGERSRTGKKGRPKDGRNGPEKLCSFGKVQHEKCWSKM